MIGKIIGNYQITGELARGGMGAVYRARHLTLPREVVVKAILLPGSQAALREHMRARFLREAHIQSQLDHPHIVRVLEFFAAEDDYYLVMEYVVGMSLQQLLARQGALPVAEALRIIRQVLSALAYAHDFAYVDETGQRRAGIVHRDIKPGNLLLDGQAQLKVTDFGIAKLLGSEALTRAGFNPGTVEYMSPEQLRGQELDPRSDIYSLGVTLYEMLAGRLPFARSSDGSDGEARRGHLELLAPPLRQWRADVPSGIAAIVMHALRKDPNERFQTAAEFLQAINDYEQRGAQSGAINIAPPSAPHAAPTIVSRPLPQPPSQPLAAAPATATSPIAAASTDKNTTPLAKPRRRRGLAIGATLLLLALTALAVFYFKFQSDRNAVAAVTASPSPQSESAATPSPSPAAALMPDSTIEAVASPSPAADNGADEASPSSTIAMQPGARAIDQQLFSFTLVGCRLAGTIATCDFVITNRDRDRRFAFDRFSTLLFDEEGGSYQSLRAHFQNQEAEARLVSGIPTKAQAIFEGLPAQTRKIALFEIAFTADSYDKVGFRNIALGNGNRPVALGDAAANSKASQSLDAQLITFSLIECRLAGTIVTCTLALTNRDKDKRFALDRFSTKITDEAGNTQACRQTRVANQEAEVRLITDVAANMRLVFEGVALQARKLSKLEIAFTSDSYGKAEFRNIPLVGNRRD